MNIKKCEGCDEMRGSDEHAAVGLSAIKRLVMRWMWEETTKTALQTTIVAVFLIFERVLYR